MEEPRVNGEMPIELYFHADPRVNGGMPLELYFICRPSSKRWDAPRVTPLWLGTGLRVNGGMPLGEPCH